MLAIGEDVSGNKKIEAYPKEDVPEKLLEDKHFSEINMASGQLKGFKITESWGVEQLWQINLALKPGQRISKVRSMHQTASESEHSKHLYLPTTFNGDNLVYKFLDTNLLAVSVETNDALELFIIDSISGRIVYTFHEDRVVVDEPYDMLLRENYFVLAFKRASHLTGLPQQELTVTEFYKNEEEKDTWKILKEKYLFGGEKTDQTQFNSAELETPFVVQESYMLPIDVKRIEMTNSQQHLTSKMLVLITSNDQVYSIENALFSARRQSKEQAEAKA